MKKLTFILALSLAIIFTLAMSVGAATVTDDATDEITLGECVIKGVDESIIPEPTVGLAYILDEETMTATVSGKGSFTGGNLVIPSSVTYGGSEYTVTKINSRIFQKMTYNLYVPDTVTFIAGGAGQGTFGNSSIDKVYIGSGLAGFERETFSGSSGFTTFICKSKVSYVGVYAFNSTTVVGTRDSYELDLSHVVRFEDLAFSASKVISTVKFGECLEFVGSEAFVNCSNMNGSVVIQPNCTLSYRCFNGTSLEQVVIKVNPGETKVMPVEMFSGASGDLTIIFDGYVTLQNYFFTGNSGTKVYMPSYSHIETLVNSNVGKQGSDRINNNRIGKVYFYSCEDGNSYTATNTGVITNEGEADCHLYTQDAVFFPANCSRYEKTAYVCYACGKEIVTNQGNTYAAHVFETEVKLPSCQSMGYVEYTCTVCGYCDVGHYEGVVSHGGTVKLYNSKDYKTVICTTKCQFCDAVLSVEDISLVNKCYIEGYGFFDATMEYVSVDSYGVLSPADVTFNKSVIYFPSCVEIGGEVVEVKTIQGFARKSIKEIYIPDSVTRLVGGSRAGAFSHVLDIKNIVVGKGVTTLEPEVFAMEAAVSLREFIFKGTIKELGTICLQRVRCEGADIPYEFNTALTYVGRQVNLDGNILREARLVKGCDLSEKFAFNNANGLKSVYIEGGDTAQTALDLGQEMMSNTATVYVYIKGYVTVSGQAVLSGQSNTRIYMSNKEAIDLFVSAIKGQNYSYRLNNSTFMDCESGTAWYVSDSQDRVVHPSIAFSHGTAWQIKDATCRENGENTESCFVCGTVVSTVSTDKKEHRFDGGVISSYSDASCYGIIVYTCVDCGVTEEKQISKDYGNHEENITILYPNGFASQGMAYISCSFCDYTKEMVTEPIFTVLGYSVNAERTSLSLGFCVNTAMLEYYEDNMGKLEFGFIIANAGDVRENGLVDNSFKLISANRGFMVKMSGYKYSYLDIKVTGIETEAAKALELVIALYSVADKDGDGEKDISYSQATLPNGNDKPIIVDGVEINTVCMNMI